MITLLTGENSFELERYLANIIKNFPGDVEKIDNESLQVAWLPDIFMGVSLFATDRLIIIRNLSDNKAIWSVLGDWIAKISENTHLVIVEPKPDKRTATFKALKKSASLKDFPLWGDRDYQLAEKWVIDKAKELSIDLNAEMSKYLIQRAGLDQWQLFGALEKLMMVDAVTISVIDDLVEANPAENVFNLLELAISGNVGKLQLMLKNLEQTEDVYRLLALISTQAFQMLAIGSASISDNVAKDFGIHPYAVSKFEKLAKMVGLVKLRKIVEIFADVDSDIKKSRAEPWFLVERALLNIAKL